MTDLVKRVIGLPGQTISRAGRHVLIDGKRLHQPWFPAAVADGTQPGPPGTSYNLTKPYVIPDHDYYVMGDNRTESCDSRYWGPISKSLIVGKVVVRVWPLHSFRIF